MSDPGSANGVVEFLTKHWGWLATAFLGLIGAVVGAYLLIKKVLPDIQGRLDKLEKVSHEQEVTRLDMSKLVKRSELYAPDGSPIYQHTGLCASQQADCQRAMCNKVDEINVSINAKLQDMDKARDETRGEIKAIFVDIHNFQLKLVELGTKLENIMSKERATQIAAITKAVLKEVNGK